MAIKVKAVERNVAFEKGAEKWAYVLQADLYNKLYELAIKDFDAIATVIADNQKALVMKTEQKAYDTAAYYNSAYNAVKAAIECDKFDGQPDAKGKVKILTILFFV